MKISSLAKSGATVLALGLATAAGVGAFGGWTDSETASTSNQFGVVDLGTGTSTLSNSFGTSSAPLAPGDTGFRLIALTNTASNALDLTNVKVWVSIGSVVDSVTRSGEVAATANDLAGDIKLAVAQCSVAWTSSDGSCSGTTTLPAAFASGATPSPIYLSTMDTSGEGKLLLSTLAKASTAYLKFSLTVDGTSDIAAVTEGASATYTWTFTSDPRAAVTNA